MYRIPIRSNELYHHGIKGMKWGIRRYQPYPDGSIRKGKEVGEAKKQPSQKPNNQTTHHSVGGNNVEKQSPSNSAVKRYIKKKMAYAGDKFVDSLITKGTNYAAEKLMRKMFEDYGKLQQKKK